MRNRATEEILNYWNGLRGARRAPLRSELDPSALRHFLPDLFIATASSAGGLSFALAGTRICELFDRELRGSDYAAAWSGGAGKRPMEIVESVLLYERPALLDVRLSPDGDEYPYDLLLMPLRSVGQRSDRVLGALTPRAAALSPLLLPVTSLALENWAFVERSGALPRLTDDVDSSSVTASLLRRLMGGGRFAQAGR